MKQANAWRLGLIAVITVLSFSCTWPSARYYMALRKTDPVDGVVLKVNFDPPADEIDLRDAIESAGLTIDRLESLEGTQNYDIGLPITAEDATIDALSDKLTAALETEFGDEFLVLRTRTFWERELEDMAAKGIPLGLDLFGGADVTLRIDEVASRKRLVQEVADRLTSMFSEGQISAEVTVPPNGLSLTVRVVKDSDARRVANILGGPEVSFDLESTPSEQELLGGVAVRLDVNTASLSQNVSDDIEGAKKIVSDRLNAFGLGQVSVTIQNQSEIRVQMPGEKNPQELIDKLTTLAVMEFRLTHDDFLNATAGLLGPDGELLPGAIVPLGYELMDYKFGGLNETTREIEYDEGKMLVRREVNFRGKNLQSAKVIQVPTDLQNPIQIAFTLDREGTEIFKNITTASAKQAARTGVANHLAVVLDGTVRSAPEMRTTIVANGVIEGGFTFEEATDLVQLLKAGSLPAPLVVERQSTVGATLGNESILSGVKALMWGAAFVVVFMILYYQMAGVIAIVALLLNVLMITMFLDWAHATLTLSGIGGILLTIGMAVDANVLIYERMREEIDAGQGVRQAINLGFDRAYRVILDSNITTLMTALVLMQFTEGQVFGFALTLSIGLIANLYTGLFVTSTLCAAWFQWRQKLSVGGFRPFKSSAFNFIKKRSVAWAVSGALLLGAVGYIHVVKGGIELGVDFEGGVLSMVRFAEPTDEETLRSMLDGSGLEGQKVQAVGGGDNDYIIRVKYLEQATGGAEAEIETRSEDLRVTMDLLLASLTEQYGEGEFTILEQSSFGAETSQQFFWMAITVLVLASFAILMYLWFRFELVFGAAAVVALIHDMGITLYLSSAWGVEVSLAEVAAMMVMLGFSVNDTIVVFDRVRENNRRLTGKTFEQICNISINQSLSRTIITSGTALFAIGAMLFVGGQGLQPFAKVLLIGTIVGTYSSMFVATPIVFVWNQKQKGRTMEALKKKEDPTGPEAAKAPAMSPRGASAAVPKRRAV